MKIGKIATREFQTAFQKLMKLHGVPGKTAFRIRSVAKQLGDELSKYEDIRTSLVSAYAEKDASGKVITEKVGNNEIAKIPSEKLQELNRELLELAEVLVPIESLKYDDLGQGSDLTPEDLFHLEFITE